MACVHEWVNKTYPGGIATVCCRCGADKPVHPAGWQPIETAPKDELVQLRGAYWGEGNGEFTDPLPGRWNESAKYWHAHNGRVWIAVRPTHWAATGATP